MSQTQSADAVYVIGFSLPAGTETIVITGNQTAVESPTCKVVIRFTMNLVVGTGAGALVVNLYRGTAIIPANRIAQNNISGGITGGLSIQIAAAAVDTLSNAGGAQYCVTLTMNGGAGSGTMQTAVLETMVLSG